MSHHLPRYGRPRVPARLSGLAALLGAAVVLVGCSAGPVTPLPSATRTPTVSAQSSPSESAPPAGESLRTLGFTHGPAAFRVPTGTVLTTSADQDQQVTLVISSPTPADVSAYLLRVLPQTGFTISRRQADAIEFSGQGWTGSFVATGAISAVTLQPV